MNRLPQIPPPPLPQANLGQVNNITWASSVLSTVACRASRPCLKIDLKKMLSFTTAAIVAGVSTNALTTKYKYWHIFKYMYVQTHFIWSTIEYLWIQEQLTLLGLISTFWFQNRKVETRHQSQSPLLRRQLLMLCLILLFISHSSSRPYIKTKFHLLYYMINASTQPDKELKFLINCKKGHIL